MPSIRGLVGAGWVEGEEASVLKNRRTLTNIAEQNKEIGGTLGEGKQTSLGYVSKIYQNAAKL